MKGSTGKNIIIALLIVALLGSMAVILYMLIAERMALSGSGESSQSSSQQESPSQTGGQASASGAGSSIPENTYDISDYVIEKDLEVQGYAGYTVKALELINLPEGTVTEFHDRQERFVYPGVIAEEQNKFSNSISYGIYGNILSIGVAQTSAPKEMEAWKTYDIYSLNIDLDSKKIVTNQELLDSYGIALEGLYDSVLRNIADNVTTDTFLLSTTGDVTADTISIGEFQSNIPGYAQTLNNRYDAITLYIKDGDLCCSFFQAEILKLLGMGNHMGIGLKGEPQVVILR